MKKKVILATLTAATLAIGCGAFVACGNGHTHTYSKDWVNDDPSGHYHAATCEDLKKGDKDYQKDFAAHVWGDDDECDVCHYVKTEQGHTHTYTEWGKDDTEHWKYCPDDEEVDESTKAEHDYTSGEDGKCECGQEDPNGGDPVSSVTLSTTQITLGIGNTEYEDLTATVAGGGTVTWTSDNPGVVSVGEENGYVEALKPGAATITATAENGDTATCEVLVEDAYYIIGGSDSLWNKVGAFGQSSAIYFMPTETPGIYKTKSFELKKDVDFQVAKVGITADNWWQSAYNGNYIKPGDTELSKNGGGNIAVGQHGKFTITLDLTGDKAVVSGVCDEPIDDGEVTIVYYLRGAMNGWNEAKTEEAAGIYAFKDNKDGTYSLTVQLTKGQEFKVAIVDNAWTNALGESALPRTKIGNKNSATAEKSYQLEWTDSDNIGVGVTGWYTFTLTPGAAKNNQLTYTYSETEPSQTPVETPEEGE